MTQKTRTQLQAQIAGWDPVEYQIDLTDSAWLKDEIATQAEAEAGLVTDKLMTPLRTAQAIAALGGGGGLSDYQRVIVVDAGGNGDYTTLSAALAAVTGASATARYCILLFGYISESVDCVAPDYVDIVGMGAQLTFTGGKAFKPSATNTTLVNVPVYTGIQFYGNGGDIVFATNARAVFRDCKIPASSITLASGCLGILFGCDVAITQILNAGTLNYVACALRATSSSAFDLSGTAIIKFYSCMIDGKSDGTEMIVIQDTAQVEFYNSTVNNQSVVAGSTALSLNDGTLRLYNTQVFCAQTGLYITSGATIYAHGCVFQGGSGLAVVGSEALTSVPIYNSVLRGGVSNITCDAGVGNGTNTVTS